MSLVPIDGAGLFCGVLRHLVQRGAACPKVFAATHFHDVFTDDLLAPHLLPVTFAHMQVMLTTRHGQLLAASGADDGADISDGDGGGDEGAQDAGEGRRVAPGERITYLYR